MIYFFYVLAGFLSGIFGGLGMGGGTLLIPVLTIFLDFDQKLSQGINLLSFLVMAIFSIYIHYRNGYIVVKNIFWIIIFGVMFSILGAVLMSFLPSKILRIGFGIFLIVLSIVEFVKVFKKWIVFWRKIEIQRNARRLAVIVDKAPKILKNIKKIKKSIEKTVDKSRLFMLYYIKLNLWGETW